MSWVYVARLEEIPPRGARVLYAGEETIGVLRTAADGLAVSGAAAAATPAAAAAEPEPTAQSKAEVTAKAAAEAAALGR